MAANNGFFIAYSEEGREYADVVSAAVKRAGGEPIDWESDSTPGGHILTNLLGAASRVRGAVIIVTPDDMIESRDEKHLTPRDNIILEIGLFVGRLGLHEVAIVVCPRSGESPKLPTDLDGLVYLSYDPDKKSKGSENLERQFRRMLERAKVTSVFHEIKTILDANRDALVNIENRDCEKYIFQKILEMVNHARVNEVIVQPDEYYSELYGSIEAAGEGTSILAVSSLSPEMWSSLPEQRVYLDRNIQAARRGAEIRRIFLQSDEDVSRISDAIKLQLRAGINIRRVPDSFKHVVSGIEDFVVFMNKDKTRCRVFIADPESFDRSRIRRGRILDNKPSQIWQVDKFQTAWDVGIPVTLDDVFGDQFRARQPPVLPSSVLPRAVITCVQAAEAKGIPLSNELKTVLIQTRLGMIAVHLRGDREMSLRKVKRFLGLKEAFLASPEYLGQAELAAGIVSAVKDPVWSMLNLVSRSVLEQEFVSTNDGTDTGYVRFPPSLLEQMPNQKTGDFEEDAA